MVSIDAWPDAARSDSDTVAGRYQLGDSGAALIRPDGFVAWHRSCSMPYAQSMLRSAVDVTLSRPESPVLERVA